MSSTLILRFGAGFLRGELAEKAWAFRAFLNKQQMANTYGTCLDVAKGTSSESELSTISADFFAMRLLESKI